MAGQSGFDHIKVTPSEVDEEVIVAGRPSQGIEASKGEPTVAPRAEESATIPDELGSSEHAAQAQSDAPSKGSREQYHETTIEDIDSFKMSTVQKVIIAIAIILIIAFVIYSITG